jgi:hypothetical protein
MLGARGYLHRRNLPAFNSNSATISGCMNA